MKNTSENWNNFRIERVNETHYPAIVQLLNTTFGNVFSVDLLRKKYATESFGGRNTGHVVFEGDLAVSYEMGLAIPLIYQSKSFLALQACDAATHPNYCKRGLYIALNEFMFNQIREEKIAGILGFPNQNSYPILIRKLGYTNCEKLQCYQINVHKIPFWGIFHRIKLEKLAIWFALKSFKKYQIPPITISSFDEKTHLIVNRSPAFLTYKLKMGSFFIQLYDTVFWVKIKGGNLFIGDLKTPSAMDFNRAIATLKSICYRSGLKDIFFQSHKGSFEEGLFAQKYESFETLPMIYRAFDDTIPHHLLKCTYADLDTF
jgi:Acetyltransferase (GNAT) domain